MNRRLLVPIAWTSGQAGATLTLASTGWLVSGLNASPLINTLVMALLALPTLLPVPRRAAAGFWLQMLAAMLLLLVSLRITGRSVAWPLLAVLLFSLGGRIGSPPLQQSLLQRSQLPLQQLRLGSSLGQVLGNLLTGVLFPIGRATLQYTHALVLMLPLLPLVTKASSPHDPSVAPIQDPGTAADAIPFRAGAILQGLLFGSLFGLLALWVRQVGAGNCFDFGMVLTAYGLGRTLAATALRPHLPAGLPYGLIAALLAATQIPGLPGWGAVALFLPMGLIAAISDEQRVAILEQGSAGPQGWLILERSGALGSLLGSLGFGLISQGIGLSGILPLEVIAFGLVALLLRGRAPVRGVTG
jgi:hypothetical protein